MIKQMSFYGYIYSIYYYNKLGLVAHKPIISVLAFFCSQLNNWVYSELNGPYYGI